VKIKKKPGIIGKKYIIQLCTRKKAAKIMIGNSSLKYDFLFSLEFFEVFVIIINSANDIMKKIKENPL